jgi:GNAT superfamily N-acetyltransferase
MIPALEERSLNAWPALQTVLYDGWVLRFAGGYTRRANSVNPLYPSTLDPVEKIAYCEQLYTARGLAPVFKLTPASTPEGLDALLAERGYRYDAPTSVQTCALADLEPAPPPDAITLAAAATPAWLETFCRLNGIAPARLPIMAQMLANIGPDRCFLSLQRDGTTVALGLAVAERGWVGLFDIVTAAEARNQGVGRQVMLALLHWGRAQGALHAYLQVMHSNAPALHLYRRLGFAEVYTYWYRIKVAP